MNYNTTDKDQSPGINADEIMVEKSEFECHTIETCKQEKEGEKSGRREFEKANQAMAAYEKLVQVDMYTRKKVINLVIHFHSNLSQISTIQQLQEKLRAAEYKKIKNKNAYHGILK